jgi:IS30 family transposase
LAVDDELRAMVQDKLELEWSPEQISAWLRLEHPDEPGEHACHETIYQAAYTLPEGAGAGTSQRSCAPVGRCAAAADAQVSAQFALSHQAS